MVVLSLPTENFYYVLLYFMCAGLCHSPCVEVRGEPVGGSFLFHPVGLWGGGEVTKAWQRVS